MFVSFFMSPFIHHFCTATEKLLNEAGDRVRTAAMESLKESGRDIKREKKETRPSGIESSIEMLVRHSQQQST